MMISMTIVSLSSILIIYFGIRNKYNEDTNNVEKSKCMDHPIR